MVRQAHHEAGGLGLTLSPSTGEAGPKSDPSQLRIPLVSDQPMRSETPFPRRLVLALALAAPLAACGRKGDPEAPEGADEKYPRQYPAPRRS
jgi:hypothetical protein